MPLAVAMASHTCSGVPGSSNVELDAEGDVGGGHDCSSGLGWCGDDEAVGRPSSWW